MPLVEHIAIRAVVRYGLEGLCLHLHLYAAKTFTLNDEILSPVILQDRVQTIQVNHIIGASVSHQHLRQTEDVVDINGGYCLCSSVIHRLHAVPSAIVNISSYNIGSRTAIHSDGNQ